MTATTDKADTITCNALELYLRPFHAIIDLLTVVSNLFTSIF